MKRFASDAGLDCSIDVLDLLVVIVVVKEAAAVTKLDNIIPKKIITGRKRDVYLLINIIHIIIASERAQFVQI